MGAHLVNPKNHLPYSDSRKQELDLTQQWSQVQIPMSALLKINALNGA